MKDKIITVFIPCYNGDKYLAESLDAVFRQSLPLDYQLEVIIIDSGSHDSSVEILKSYGSKITLLEIPNSEYGHGKTRQKAAEIAKGEFILFLSQDATPYDENWLRNMIEPFFISDKVGCVFGRQIPRRNAAVTIKREVASVFGGLGSPDTISVHSPLSLVDNTPVRTGNTFFSDVNSAVRRSLLISSTPFRDVRYAEDQALAEDMLSHGMIKAYAPLGAVWHSNEYTPKEYFHRKYDEYVGLRDSVGLQLRPSYRSLLFGWIRPTLRDWGFVLHDTEYSFRSKVVWTIESPLFNIAAQAGKFQALKRAPGHDTDAKYSLEARRKG